TYKAGQPYCATETRTCNNGVLSGSHTFASCTYEAAKNCEHLGVKINHGHSHYFYLGTVAANCNGFSAKDSQPLTCNDGVLTRSFTNELTQPLSALKASCTEVPGCD